MIRFSISIPTQLNDWLELQASRNNRSKSKEIITYIEQAMHRYAKLDTGCMPPVHVFDTGVKFGDLCRCGLARFGGQVDV